MALILFTPSCVHTLYHKTLQVFPLKRWTIFLWYLTLGLAMWWNLADGTLANVRWPKSRSTYVIRLAFLPLCQHLEKHVPRLACWSQKEDERHVEQSQVTQAEPREIHWYLVNPTDAWVSPAGISRVTQLKPRLDQLNSCWLGYSWAK